MFLQFLELITVTYITVTGIKLGSNYFLNNIMYLRTSKNIEDNCESWINKNTNDEWISASLNEKKYRQRKIDSLENNKELCDEESDEEEDSDSDIDILLEEPENILNKSRLTRLYDIIKSDNRTTFSTTYKSITLILYIKTMLGWGFYNELIVGIFLGIIAHFIDFISIFSQKLTSKYFDNKVKIDLESILSRKNKFRLKTMIIIPFAVLFLLTLLKANVYTRILGEWIMDLNQIYLYIGQILGLMMVQNGIDILAVSKENPLMIMMFGVYIIFSILI